MRNIIRATGVLIAALTLAQARAQDGVAFLKDRPMSLIVGYGTGGGYDVYARHLARHMSRFLPGAPTIVVQNMPGAGSLTAANFIYNSAPKDGSTFGTFAREMPLSALLKANPNVRFDPTRFTWIGTPAGGNEEVYLMFIRKEAPIKDARDLLRAGGPELVVGGTGAGSGGNDWALLLRDGLGLRIKLIAGYRDSNALFLSVERGEIDARSLDYSAVRSSRPDWVSPNGPVRLLLQFGTSNRHPDFPDTMTARELARSPDELALLELAELSNTLARPFAAPPGVPKPQADALRRAFANMVKDPEYLAEANKLRIDIAPLSGEEVLEVISKLAQAPPQVLEQMRRIRSASEGQ
jgi:tripartite-type tricarboxylate transporter receptor subunit TctC